jgi:hypothetical protein
MTTLVRSKTCTQKKIASNSFTTKRNIECDDDEKEELRTFVKSLKENELMNIPLVMKDENGKVIIKSNSVRRHKTHFEFANSYNYPDLIISLYNQIKALFTLKKEIVSFTLRIFPPLECDKKSPKEIYTIPKAEMSTVMRVIYVIGGREKFTFEINDAEDEVICLSGDCVSLPIGAAEMINISFDNTFYMTIPDKNGHRKNRSLMKDPSSRYILVFDMSSSMEMIGKYMGQEATRVMGGLNNPFLIQKLNDMFNLNIEIKEDEDVSAFIKSLEEK